MIMVTRGGSRTVATSKMERFVIIVNGWKPLTIITKRSILDIAAVLDPPLVTHQESDEIEQITKFSHCKAYFCLFISFSEQKIAYVTHTFNNKFYVDSTEILAH